VSGEKKDRGWGAFVAQTLLAAVLSAGVIGAVLRLPLAGSRSLLWRGRSFRLSE
jgi:hypothetical protein